jgi:hypothetical protein
VKVLQPTNIALAPGDLSGKLRLTFSDVGALLGPTLDIPEMVLLSLNGRVVLGLQLTCLLSTPRFLQNPKRRNPSDDCERGGTPGRAAYLYHIPFQR